MTTKKLDRDTAEIMEQVVLLAEYYQQTFGESLDESIETALRIEVNFGYTNAGNTWYRTTGDRQGITSEQVKTVLQVKRNVS